MKKQFEILSFTRQDDFITVNIDERVINIPEHKYIKWLISHDKLYYEDATHNFGELVIKSYYITFDEYWECLSWMDKADDLYDFIKEHHIDYQPNVFQQWLNLFLQ